MLATKLGQFGTRHCIEPAIAIALFSARFADEMAGLLVCTESVAVTRRYLVEPLRFWMYAALSASTKRASTRPVGFP
jgi:hypothetical protein